MKWLPLVTFIATIQTVAPSPHQLARVARPLEPAEIAVVLQGSRDAIANKTFTLSFPGRREGPQFLMRGDGRPSWMRTIYGINGGTVGGDGSRSEWHDDFIDVVNYTGARAERCDGTALTGELVITYGHRASTGKWTLTAAITAVDFHGTPADIGAPIFDMLSGTTPLSSDLAQQTGDGRSTTRAFTAPFSTPPHSPRGGYGLGDPPAAATQSLLIDIDSLLPMRWEVRIGDRVGYELVFDYAPLDLRPPDGFSPPRCVP